MNYIAEINRFYNWLITNPISGNAQALWHRLMSYCNTFSWKNDFTITNSRLADELCISRQELDRIRNILCQKGLITYEKGKGNQCGTYHINSFVSQDDVDCVTQTDTQLLHKADTNTYTNTTQVDTQMLPLDKLNETKLNETIFKENNTKENQQKKSNSFVKPSLEEIKEYCQERNNNVDCEKWLDYYTANGFKVGKNQMKDWKACVRNWEKNAYSSTKQDDEPKPSLDIDKIKEYWGSHMPKF